MYGSQPDPKACRDCSHPVEFARETFANCRSRNADFDHDVPWLCGRCSDQRVARFTVFGFRKTGAPIAPPLVAAVA